MNAYITKPSRVLVRMAVCMGMLAMAQYTLVSARSADASGNQGQLSAADYKFATTAARGSTLEVMLGNLAQKSTTHAVDEFGQRMVEDHGKAGKQLSSLATQKGATLPAGITDEQQKQVDHLGLLSGSDFDRSYVTFMVRAHRTDLKEFKRAAQEVQDPDLKAFATSLVPIIQEHLSMAESLDENLKSGLSLNN